MDFVIAVYNFQYIYFTDYLQNIPTDRQQILYSTKPKLRFRDLLWAKIYLAFKTNQCKANKSDKNN